MSNALHITRRQLPSGKFRYEVDGKVHTAKSGRLYTHASVYRAEDGSDVVFLHARVDLALKGSPDANRIAKAGGWSRVPGAVEIQEVGA